MVLDQVSRLRILRIIARKKQEYNQGRFVVFIHLEKAFHRSDRKMLGKVLETDIITNSKLIRKIKNMYEIYKAKVKNRDGGNEDWFEVRKSVR